MIAEASAASMHVRSQFQFEQNRSEVGVVAEVGTR